MGHPGHPGHPGLPLHKAEPNFSIYPAYPGYPLPSHALHALHDQMAAAAAASKARQPHPQHPAQHPSLAADPKGSNSVIVKNDSKSPRPLNVPSTSPKLPPHQQYPYRVPGVQLPVPSPLSSQPPAPLGHAPSPMRPMAQAQRRSPLSPPQRQSPEQLPRGYAGKPGTVSGPAYSASVTYLQAQQQHAQQLAHQQYAASTSPAPISRHKVTSSPAPSTFYTKPVKPAPSASEPAATTDSADQPLPLTSKAPPVTPSPYQPLTVPLTEPRVYMPGDHRNDRADTRTDPRASTTLTNVMLDPRSYGQGVPPHVQGLPQHGAVQLTPAHGQQAHTAPSAHGKPPTPHHGASTPGQSPGLPSPIMPSQRASPLQVQTQPLDLVSDRSASGSPNKRRSPFQPPLAEKKPRLDLQQQQQHMGLLGPPLAVHYAMGPSLAPPKMSPMSPPNNPRASPVSPHPRINAMSPPGPAVGPPAPVNSVALGLVHPKGSPRASPLPQGMPQQQASPRASPNPLHCNAPTTLMTALSPPPVPLRVPSTGPGPGHGPGPGPGPGPGGPATVFPSVSPVPFHSLGAPLSSPMRPSDATGHVSPSPFPAPSPAPRAASSASPAPAVSPAPAAAPAAAPTSAPASAPAPAPAASPSPAPPKCATPTATSNAPSPGPQPPAAATPPAAPTPAPSGGVHKLKKAWLHRHAGEDTTEDMTDIVGSGSCVTLPIQLDKPQPPAPAKSTAVSSISNVGSMAVNSINRSTKAHPNAKTPRKGASGRDVGAGAGGVGVGANGHGPDNNSSSSEAEVKPSPPPRRSPKVKGRKTAANNRRQARKTTTVRSYSESGSESDKESGTEKDSDSGASHKKPSGSGDSGAKGRRRGRRPKSKNGEDEGGKSKRAREPFFKKPPVSQLKRTGESFLQDGACFEVAPKLAKCRECRWTPHQRSKNMPNIFCRFYAFRKLRYTKNGQLAIAGFSNPFKDCLEVSRHHVLNFIFQYSELRLFVF